MLDTLPIRRLNLNFADLRLADEVCPSGSSSQEWHVAQLELVKLALEGDARTRRLSLWVDVLLQSRAPDAQRPLRLTLVSEAWSQADSWPPSHIRVDLEPADKEDENDNGGQSNVVGGQSADPLGYTVTEVVPGDSTESNESFWQSFLVTADEPTTPAHDGAVISAISDPSDLLAVVADWITAELRADTVGGALRCVEFGEAGFFGPVKRVVLRRSAQADLELDATLLGEASDTEDGAEEPTLILELYGDRHGAWVLYRRRLVPRNKRRAGAEAVPGVYDCDVLIADSAAELVAQAGLGRVEKRLFQSVGVLPNDTLRDHYGVVESEAVAGGAKLLDLSAVPDRSRRFLEAINALAVAGKLSTHDLDAMLRTARLLARSNR